MRHWLTQLVPRKNEDKHESITAATSKIIQKHQKIITFSQNIENLYSYIALIQFVSNTIMICSLAYVIVTVSNIVKYKTIVILSVIANDTILLDINLSFNILLYITFV